MKKLSIFLAFVMLFTIIPMGALATEAATDITTTNYFLESFEYDGVENETALSTSTSAGYGDWRLAANNYDTAKSEGTEINVKKESDTNNVLHIVRTTRDANHVHLEAGQKLSGIPTTGIVKLSFRMMCALNNHNVLLRGVFTELRSDRVTLESGGHQFKPANAEQTAKLCTPEVWNTYELVIDYNANTTTLYIDDVQIGDAYTTAVKITQIGFLQQRNQNYVAGDVYFDDISIDSTSVAKIDTFNPASIGNIYVDANLANKITLDGTEYDITYLTSDPSVIAEDGTVTTTDFFTSVTVTPQVEIDHVNFSAPTVILTVLPKNYDVKLSENFNGLNEGNLFDKTTAASNNPSSGWNLGLFENNYKLSSAVTEIIKESDENSYLHMKLTEDTKVYRLNHALETSDCGDRIAMSFRVKNIHANTNGIGLNLFSPYMGRFRSNYPDTWRGDYTAIQYADENSESTDVQSAKFYTKNVWRTYLFICDTGITEEYTQWNTENKIACHPISLYIDGEYMGTSWTNVNNMEAAATNLEFYMNPGSAGGTDADFYIDDLMIMNFDSEDVQFTGATVDGGAITHVGLQYASYGSSAISGTVFAGAYDAEGKLIQVGVLGTATAAEAGFTTADVIDYVLPEGTASYRLFLFDSIETLKPLAVSKTIALK